VLDATAIRPGGATVEVRGDSPGEALGALMRDFRGSFCHVAATADALACVSFSREESPAFNSTQKLQT